MVAVEMSLRLFQAIVNGDREAVAELLDAGANANYCDWSGEGDWVGYVPTQLAAHFDHVEILRILLRAGAEDRSYIDEAIHFQSYECIKEWMKDGGSLDEPIDEYKKTRLMLAIEKASVKVVELLLNYGVDLESKDEYGDTALMVAADLGKSNFVRMLWDGTPIESKRKHTTLARRYGLIID